MNTAAPVADSYYERIDEHRYKPTVHAGGAWEADDQHFSPLGGLIVHAMDRYLAGRCAGGPADGRTGGLVMSRISFDILGRLALDECRIEVETIRPGRTIELLEAVVFMGDRAVVRARAWLLAAVDTSAVAGGTGDRPASPDSLPSWEMSSRWPGGFIASLDVRPVSPPQAGRTTAWVSTGLGLVAGEPSSPTASFVALVDTANGIAVRQEPTEWMFPNVDLTIHLHRRPEGRWTGLDTSVTFGGTGQGVTSTVLHDVTGPVGHAQQMLTVRPLPGA